MKIKKLLFTITTLLLVLSMVGCSGANEEKVLDDGKPRMSIGDVKGKKGATVDVAITMQNNPGVWGGQIIIDYDSDNLEFVSIDNGAVFKTCDVNDTGENVVILATHDTTTAGNIDSKTDGTVAILKFMIKSTAKKGDKTLSFNKDTEFINSKDEFLNSIKLDGGKITVE